MEAIQFVQDNAAVILGALLATGEVLALIPSIKSNSVLQLIVNTLKALAKK